MNKPMSLTEIERSYPDQWVLLGDVVKTPAIEILSGRVLFAATDRKAVYQKAMELRPGPFAVCFTGRTPKGRVFAL